MTLAIICCVLATLIIFTALLAYACVRASTKPWPSKTENKEKNWTVVEWEYEDDGIQEMHILPNNDHIIHEIPGTHCPCGASWTRHHGVSIYRHASLDGREAHE